MRKLVAIAAFTVCVFVQHVGAQVPSSRSRLAHALVNGKHTWLRIVDGYALWQGDIVLGRADDVLARSEAQSSKTNQKQGLITTAVSLWPTTTIPYTIDAAVKNPQNFLDAIQHWNDHTVIRF